MARQEIDLTTPQPNGKMGEPTKAAWEKVNSMTAEIYANMAAQTSNFISGFRMKWNASNNISISEGAAYIPSLSRVVKLPSQVTIPGITLPAASWAHLYLYESSGVGAIEYSSTAPSAPYSGTARTKTGDTSRRYIGSVRTIAANQVARFSHDEVSNTITYMIDTNLSFIVVLNNTSSPGASSNVSCSTAVPITSTRAYLLMENMGSTAANVAYIANPDMGEASESNILRYVRIGIMYESLMPLSSNQQFNYLTSGNLTVRAVGYVYDR